jgi:hypothetical protein
VQRGIAAITVVGCASPAMSAYYVGKPVAEHYLRVLLHERYGYTNTGVYYRPQRARQGSYGKHGRVLYHRWLCGFVAGVSSPPDSTGCGHRASPHPRRNRRCL